MRLIRYAPFALRVVNRANGRGAVIYRRRPDSRGRDRLQKLASISTLAFVAGTPLLRDAVSKSVIHAPVSRRRQSRSQKSEESGRVNGLQPGKFYPLDADWGARAACFAFVAFRLANAERLMKSADHFRHADPNEAAWWLGMLTRDDNTRVLRALRILTEAVE